MRGLFFQGCQTNLVSVEADFEELSDINLYSKMESNSTGEEKEMKGCLSCVWDE